MKATAEQEFVIRQQDRNLVVVAAAGSGKTHVLVERFLSLLDTNEDWRLISLVAITFTRAAAQEMRERIRSQLEERLRHATSEQAQKRWSTCLDELPQARIQTIHSLCGDILRANAAHMGLDPNFRIIEPAESATLLDDAIEHELARSVDRNSIYHSLFIHFRERDIRAVLREEMEPLSPIASVDELFGGWCDDWRESATPAIATFLKQFGQPAIEPPDNDKLGKEWREILCHLSALHKFEKKHDIELAYSTIKDISELSLRNVGKADNWGGKDLLNASRLKRKELVGAAKDLCNELGTPPNELDRLAAEDLQRWTNLIRRVQRRFRHLKKRIDALDYADLEELCDQLLQDEEICNRYHREFRQLLVDEFQDTNERQWRIIRALARAELSNNLFLVGDPRQSIYAFRGADVRVFKRVLQHIGQDFHKTSLSVSFRTHRPLLKGLNDFFGRILDQDEDDTANGYEVSMGEELRAHRQCSVGQSPHIELLLINQSQLRKAWENRDRQAARRWEARELAGRIADWLAEKRRVQDMITGKERTIALDDIVILFRSLNSIAIYEEVFAAEGLPYVTHAGRGFFEQQEIWDILNLLAAVENPLDELSLAAALRSPLFNLSDDSLYALRRSGQDKPRHRVFLWDVLSRVDGGEFLPLPKSEIAKIRRAWRLLADLRSLGDRLTVAEMIDEALERSNFRAIVSHHPNGERMRGNLEKLLEVAHSQGNISFHDFQKYVKNIRAREIHESQAELEVSGAISMMTIHASKGREFPVVILADLGRAMPRIRNPLFLQESELGAGCRVLNEDTGEIEDTHHHRKIRQAEKKKALAEEKRLLYVAMTRARDHLLLSGMVQEKKGNGWRKENANWMSILDWLAIRNSDGLLLDCATVKTYPWGTARVWYAYTPPPEKWTNTLSSAQENHSQNDIVALREPPLLREAPSFERRGIVHVAASKLIPKFQPRDCWEDIANRQTDSNEETMSKGIGVSLGSLIHIVLREENKLKDAIDIEKWLAKLCWCLGLGNHEETQYLIKEASSILTTYQQSGLYRELSNLGDAEKYREYPFIFRAENCVLHGRMDLLYRRPNEDWVIIDYKTHKVANSSFDKHAKKQFSSQLAAYYAATRREFGATLKVGVHYLRYGRTVYLPVASLKEEELRLFQLPLRRSIR